MLFAIALPDPRQRERGRGCGPGDLAALRGLPDTTNVDQGIPLGRGDPDLDRRAALGPRPAGGVRRALVSRAAADRFLPGPRAVGGVHPLGSRRARLGDGRHRAVSATGALHTGPYRMSATSVRVRTSASWPGRGRRGALP